MDLLTLDAFRPYVNRSFRVVGGAGGAVEMELAEAAEHGHPPRPGGRKGFTLVFRGPMRPILPQAIYRFEGPDSGPLDIFIVPIGPDAVGMRYEAVFN